MNQNKNPRLEVGRYHPFLKNYRMYIVIYYFVRYTKIWYIIVFSQFIKIRLSYVQRYYK